MSPLLAQSGHGLVHRTSALLGSNRCRLPDAYFAGLRHHEEGDDEAHRRDQDRVEQRVADAAGGRESRAFALWWPL
jgi:hypothetical protein